ncbi:MAG: hypothetical protein U0234_11620 [Sandaracinus sp.]
MDRARLRFLAAVATLALTPVALAQVAPATLGRAQTVVVPAAPTVAFEVDAPGEYRIDAQGGDMDAQLLLVQGGSIFTSDSDSGEGVDARIVAFLAPGSYAARVTEYQGRAMSARVTVARLPPLTPVATVTPGAPPTLVAVPRGDDARSGAAEVTLEISAAGSYRIDVVSPDASADPELTLIARSAVVASDSDSGEGTNAQLVRDLAPGTYTLRVRDWQNRAASLRVTVARN